MSGNENQPADQVNPNPAPQIGQGQNELNEKRYAKIIAATGIKPEYLPTWCDLRERETAMLCELEYPYWTIKDPDGHLVHTVLSCDKDDAIKEWLGTEQAVQWAANLFRAAAGEEPCCTQSWELFEAQGYSLARVDIIEAPSDGDGNEKSLAAPGSPKSASSSYLGANKDL